jgi:hypothetical protein
VLLFWVDTHAALPGPRVLRCPHDTMSSIEARRGGLDGGLMSSIQDLPLD